jgi:hypothetical protein
MRTADRQSWRHKPVNQQAQAHGESYKDHVVAQILMSHPELTKSGVDVMCLCNDNGESGEAQKNNGVPIVRPPPIEPIGEGDMR